MDNLIAEAHQLQEAFAQALLLQQSDTRGLCERWKQIDIPFSLKYRGLKITEFIRDNVQESSQMKCLIEAFGVLYKYGFNLLKPLQNRPPNWQLIKFSNNIFRTKIQVVKGSKEVLWMMGYSEDTGQSLVFPDGMEPDTSVVAMITAALLLAKDELQEYTQGFHPNKHRILECQSQPSPIVDGFQEKLGLLSMPAYSRSQMPFSQNVPPQPSTVEFHPGAHAGPEPSYSSTFSGQEQFCGMPACKNVAVDNCTTCQMALCEKCHSDISGGAPSLHQITKLVTQTSVRKLENGSQLQQMTDHDQPTDTLPPISCILKPGPAYLPRMGSTQRVGPRLPVDPVHVNQQPGSRTQNLGQGDLMYRYTAAYVKDGDTVVKAKQTLETSRSMIPHLQMFSNPNTLSRLDERHIPETGSIVSSNVADIMEIRSPREKKAKIEERLKKLEEKMKVLDTHVRQVILEEDDFTENLQYIVLTKKKEMVRSEWETLEQLHSHVSEQLEIAEAEEAQKVAKVRPLVQGKLPIVPEDTGEEREMFGNMAKEQRGSEAFSDLDKQFQGAMPNLKELPHSLSGEPFKQAKLPFEKTSLIPSFQVTSGDSEVVIKSQNVPSGILPGLQNGKWEDEKPGWGKEVSSTVPVSVSSTAENSPQRAHVTTSTSPSLGTQAATSSPAQVSQGQTCHTVWQCKYCDFVNGREASICEYCSEGIRELGLIPGAANQSQVAQSAAAEAAKTWQCDYCTYANPVQAKVCSICDRTRANDTNSSEEKDSFWSCPDCTYNNSLLALSCEICGKAQEMEKEDTWSCPKCTFQNPYTTAVCEMCKIKNHQIQVQPSKKESEAVSGVKAQEQPDKKRGSVSPPKGTRAPCQGEDSNSEYESASEGKAPSPVQDLTCWGSSPSVEGMSAATLGTGHPQHSPGTEHAQAPIRDAASTQPASPEPQKDIKKEDEIQKNLVTPSTEKFNKEKSFEDLAEKKEKEILYTHGKEMIDWIRAADEHDFDVEELEFAMALSAEQENPIEWLRDSLEDYVTMVADNATDIGPDMTGDAVGRISLAEAWDAFRSCRGQVEEAAELCVSTRVEKIEEVMSYGEFDEELVRHSLYSCDGDVEAVVMEMTQFHFNPLLENIWAGQPEEQEEASGGDVDYVPLYKELTDECFIETITDRSQPVERRARMALLEGKLQGWARAENVVHLLDEMDLLSDDVTVEDVITAVRSRGDREEAKRTLLRDCQICFCPVPMRKLLSLTTCSCDVCKDCFVSYFEFQIKEKTVVDLACPVCNGPDFSNDDVGDNYFQLLDQQLKNFVTKDIYILFEKKLRDWNLQRDPNFVWCAHCENGFLVQNLHAHKAQCVNCMNYMCWQCKIPWDEDHTDRSCEEYKSYKETQAEERSIYQQLDHSGEGIVCPNCRLKYALAKGGCIHFVCRECKHEFCCGCSRPFVRGRQCLVGLPSCAGKGLHCHHPRACLNFMRDYEVKRLQELLQKNSVEYKTAAAENDRHKTCPVMEQKEIVEGREYKDEECGRKVEANQAGLCEIHYKEYLVQLINERKLDPAMIMTRDELVILLQREETAFQPKAANESKAQFLQRLRQIVQDELPL